MNHEQETIWQITVAIGVALIGGLTAFRLKQSPIVGYLLAGVCIGPFTPGFVGDRNNIATLAEVGVIFLMFALGIEFSIKELARIKGAAIVGTSLQLLLVIACGTGLGMALGWSWISSVFFGGVVSVSSTMVILKNLLDRGEVEASHGRLLLSMLIVQDLAVVLLILLLPRLAQSGGLVPSELLIVIIKTVLFIAVTLWLGDRVIPRLMAHVEELGSPELFILTAVALALGTASISGLLGLSPALGAFMAGLMLTETEFDHRVVAEVVPMRDLFATLFFVSVGMLIDIRFMFANWPAVLGMAAFIMATKVLCTTLALSPFRLGGKTTAFAALGMISIGEFNYVLALAGKTSGAISDEIYNLILTSSLLTIVLSPGAFWIAPRADKVLSRLNLWTKWLQPRTPEMAPPPQLQDHAIVVGYGRVGRRLERGLRQAGLTVVVIENDLHLVQELRNAGHDAIYGDASHEAILKLAHPQNARVVVVALPDFGATRAVVHRARRMNQDALIVARAQRSENDARLREAGASTVVVPEIAGALSLLEETLIQLGLPHEHVFTGLGSLLVAPELAPASGASASSKATKVL